MRLSRVKRVREAVKRHAMDDLTRDAMAIGLGVGVYGVTFGILAGTAGATVLQAVALSAFAFNGASQIALVGVLQAGGTPGAALGSAMLLAARNGVYGFALAPVLGGSPLRRAVAAQLVIDEPTAMAASQSDPRRGERAFWLTGVSIFLFWNTGTLAGALTGRALGPPEQFGLDAAFPAAFLALLVPQLGSRDARLAAAAGALIALTLVPLTPAGAPILLASLGALAGWGFSQRRED